MQVKVIKKESPRKAFINRVFPKGNLDVVTKTCDITVAEFKKLWSNTGGHKNVGHQYSNMSEYDYVFAMDCEYKEGYYNLELSNTVTDYREGNWATYFAQAGKKIHRTKTKADELNKGFSICYRRKFKYGRKDNGIYVVARRSKCGNFVTVFRT